MQARARTVSASTCMLACLHTVSACKRTVAVCSRMEIVKRGGEARKSNSCRPRACLVKKAKRIDLNIESSM